MTYPLLLSVEHHGLEVARMPFNKITIEDALNTALRLTQNDDAESWVDKLSRSPTRYVPRYMRELDEVRSTKTGDVIVVVIILKQSKAWKQETITTRFQILDFGFKEIS